jgi:predicted RNA-binding protein with RPS1 domain
MVKVLEVDRQRGRISLSIRQATDPPARGARPQDKARRPEKSRQEPDLSSMDLKDALGALKRKFSR